MLTRTNAGRQDAVEVQDVRIAGSRAVELWLWSVAALVFAMIVVGGATRLTDSGLSITEWKPILGAIPPLSDADWLIAFEKYKLIPEYRLVNQGMALEAFKSIYWWEWGHRFLGRIIGLAVALPLLVFWASGRLRQGLTPKLIGVLALGGLQGAIGWYMVSSGLSERVDVSQYRLALHLTTAFTIFAALIWLVLDERRALNPAVAGQTGRSVKRLAAGLTLLVFAQVILGAFVAGLKAGLVYNTWPLMDGQWFPSEYWSANPAYLSVFESHAAAQFNHRLSAYLLIVAALAQLWMVVRQPAGDAVRRTTIILCAAILAQMTIGIVTLLAHVPLHLGLLHQGGGALVLAIAIWHLYTAQRAIVSA